MIVCVGRDFGLIYFEKVCSRRKGKIQYALRPRTGEPTRRIGPTHSPFPRGEGGLSSVSSLALDVGEEMASQLKKQSPTQHDNRGVLSERLA